MKTAIILLFAVGISIQMSAQCSQDENVIRFMTRGKAAIKMAEKPEDYKLAADEFTKALEYDTKCPDIYYNLALCYEQLGELDPGNYQEAINYLNIYLSLSPDVPNKQEIQEKIYELEFLFEKAGGVSLQSLIGKWKFYWGGGNEEDDFFDIEIFKNGGDFYAKYCGDKRSSTDIIIRRDKSMESTDSLFRNNYESSIIQYENGIFLLNVNPYRQHTEHHPKEGNLNRFNNGISTYRELEYSLKFENGTLKGDRICKKFVKKSYSKSGWETIEDCNGDCGKGKVYFVKQ
jgi:tetratricopeptide (TPR) repeat protein